ncbi:MAG: 23S rRNA (guanosine(2251)-2'-O)-methyltransferase RlmB [Bacteroidetes bacterium]|nr:23S rRNA (guanosine(2251)-2'-O)-methyltransferase RlmB [Bacteroidota bacterium]
MYKANNKQLIYGLHAVKEALDAGRDFIKIQAERGIRNPLFDDIRNLCQKADIPIQFVPREKLDFMGTKNHQGICGFISPVSYHKLENLVPTLYESGKDPFILVLDRLTDVRNLGAIARTALCAGVDAIVIPFTETAPVNEDAVKTSAGALLKIPICREKHLKTSLELLNQSGFTTVACTEKTKHTLEETNLCGPLAIVMGNEETGISNDLIRKCTYLSKIPMDFGVSSLNVSVAAGIALYEALRQRSKEVSV